MQYGINLVIYDELVNVSYAHDLNAIKKTIIKKGLIVGDKIISLQVIGPD